MTELQEADDEPRRDVDDESRRDVEDEHLATVEDGCGCSEVWEHLSEQRADD